MPACLQLCCCLDALLKPHCTWCTTFEIWLISLEAYTSNNLPLQLLNWLPFNSFCADELAAQKMHTAIAAFNRMPASARRLFMRSVIAGAAAVGDLTAAHHKRNWHAMCCRFSASCACLLNEPMHSRCLLINGEASSIGLEHPYSLRPRHCQLIMGQNFIWLQKAHKRHLRHC